jgi:cytochrome b6-f complex iron-sulfur subunit
MAERPSVKDILAAARRAGAAKPEGEAPAPEVASAESPEPTPVEASGSVAAPAAPVADVPTPTSLGRPLTLKEKLAAARAGGAPAAPAAKAAAPAESEPEVVVEPDHAAEAPPAVAAPSPASLGRPLTLKEKLAAARAGGAPAPTAKAPPASAPPAQDEPAVIVEPDLSGDSPAAVPAPAPSLGRPLTLKEKLAAARSGGASASPAPAGAKPAAARPAAATAAKAAAPRTLPPLEKMTDPKDLAEALRQTGAKKNKEVAAAAAARTAEEEGATPARAAVAAKTATREKAAAPKTTLPKPSKAAAVAASQSNRRSFLLVSWVAVGWAFFGTGLGAFAAMMGRFMFPNVLAEPPSTIKVGVPTNFESEEVNERWKAEWGFWIVRSSRYDGQDSLYALQSVCTHLGCPPNWLAGEQKFKCPCHGSGFYISGVNFEGPAPRPLERFKVTMADDGQIIVDKSQKFQEELGQWSDPDSFIAV